MNKYKKFVGDTLIFAVGSFGSKILAFLFVSLYTSKLTTEEFGNADIIITTISLLLPVLTFGIAEGVLRFLHDKNADSNKIFSIGVLTVLFANAVCFLIFLLLSFVWELLNTYFIYFVLLFLLIAFDEIFSNFVKGIGKTKIYALKGIVYTIVFIISNIVFLVIFNYGIIGYLTSFLIAYLADIIVMVAFARLYKYRISLKFDKKLIRAIFIYSIAFVPGTIAWWINASADKYMLVWFIGSSANGLYSVAQKIPSLITAITTIITQAWQLSAMKNYGERDFDHFFSEVFNVLMSILFVGTSFVLLINKHLAFILFQKDFFVAWRFVPMLTVASLFSTTAGFLASAFTSAKKTKHLLISTCVSAIFNIVLNYVLITTIGEFGVAVSTAASFGLLVVIRIFTSKKLVKLHTNYLRLSLSIFVLFASSFAVAFLSETYYYFLSIITFFVILLLNTKELIYFFKKIPIFHKNNV